MDTRRFHSKVDKWLVIVFLAAVVGQLAAVVSVLKHSDDALAVAVVVASTLAVFLLVGSMYRYTYYEVDGGQLRIVCGPFRWRVPIAEISAVEPTRNPLSSPALSLDRLRITYGNNRKIMVSPADKEGFLQAIGQDSE